MSITRHALRVYASLSALKETRSDDVIDALVPFFIPLLQRMPGKVVSPSLIVKAAKMFYGWNFNEEVALSFIRRFHEKSLVEVQRHNSKIVYVGKEFDDPLEGTEDLSVAEGFDEIIDMFEAFPDRLSDIIHLSYTKEQLADILVRFLVSLDAYTDETLTTELRNMYRGVKGKREIDGLEAGGRPLGNEEQYLCAKFVHYLYREHPLLIDHLVRIVEVGLLVEVIEEFRKPTQKRTNTNLTIFLDAPLALSILDVSGARIREEADTIVNALKSIGCRIQILSESIKEIKRVLRGVLRSQKSDRYGPTHGAIIRKEVSEEYVQSVLNDPELALQHYEIDVRYITEDQYPNSHHLFDGERITDLISKITWERMGAREHDSRCIAYTMRLRVNPGDKLDSRIGRMI